MGPVWNSILPGVRFWRWGSKDPEKGGEGVGRDGSRLPLQLREPWPWSQRNPWKQPCRIFGGGKQRVAMETIPQQPTPLGAQGVSLNKNCHLGAPGWLRQQSMQLLIRPPPNWVQKLLKIFKKKKRKQLKINKPDVQSCSQEKKTNKLKKRKGKKIVMIVQLSMFIEWLL